MTIARANEFIDKYIQDGRSCLIIGHGFFFRVLSKEMLKRNFKGKEIVYIRNGEYYTYETI
jgi:bisphosphoglycerate-dependent phosphoglycerate mutase